MDLNGKAGARLGIILIIAVTVFSLYFSLREPVYYHTFPYQIIDSTICFPSDEIAIGDEMASSEEEFNMLFEGNDYKLRAPVFLEDEDDWAGAASGHFIVGGLPFNRKCAAVLGGTLRQVSYDKDFNGLLSVYKSNKFFKTLCYSFKESYGNNSNIIQAQSEKKKPSKHSFNILLKRERLGFGFYNLKVVFSQPGYEDTDLYSGDNFD